MAKTREYAVASRTSRIVLALTAAMSLCAALAAAPSAYAVKGEISVAKPIKSNIGQDVNGMRPLGGGPAIQVGRAYGAEDEDCTLAVTQTTDSTGRVHFTRRVTCAD